MPIKYTALKHPRARGRNERQFITNKNINTMKSFTLLSRFSFPKSCLADNKYPKTNVFLKCQVVGYIPKKSIFISRTRHQIFMWSSRWTISTSAKTIWVFEVFGACRRNDLIRLNLDDVVDKERFLVAFLRHGKIHTSESFVLRCVLNSFDPRTSAIEAFGKQPKT